jgi:hypothetical protein
MEYQGVKYYMGTHVNAERTTKKAEDGSSTSKMFEPQPTNTEQETIAPIGNFVYNFTNIKATDTVDPSKNIPLINQLNNPEHGDALDPKRLELLKHEQIPIQQQEQIGTKITQNKLSNNTITTSTREEGQHVHAQGGSIFKDAVHFQPRLEIGEVNDPLEYEAERVAHQVTSSPLPSAVNSVPVQIQCLAGGNNTGSLQLAPPSVERTLVRGGQPLEPIVRHDMERRFGYDFSNVRVHDDVQAQASACDVNAHAYTSGSHIVFAGGKYSPSTKDGRRILAHELTHVVQQSQGSNYLQRLIRSPYPWIGVIIPRIGANIRSTPNLSDPSNIIDALPQREKVKVLHASGDWLYVRTHRNPAMEGYIYHTSVDDATSKRMDQSVADTETRTWKPSGPGSGTTFESWASAPKKDSFPAVTQLTIMNCWEAVLLSAYRAGAISWDWIHNLYVSIPMGDWVDAMSRGVRREYNIIGPNLPIQRGDLVFFDGLAHVALATGNGSDVFTFWPPPDTPFTHGGTLDRVKVFTIEELTEWWETNFGSTPTVEFVAPAW